MAQFSSALHFTQWTICRSVSQSVSEKVRISIQVKENLLYVNANCTFWCQNMFMSRLLDGRGLCFSPEGIVGTTQKVANSGKSNVGAKKKTDTKKMAMTVQESSAWQPMALAQSNSPKTRRHFLTIQCVLYCRAWPLHSPLWHLRPRTCIDGTIY